MAETTRTEPSEAQKRVQSKEHLDELRKKSMKMALEMTPEEKAEREAKRTAAMVFIREYHKENACLPRRGLVAEASGLRPDLATKALKRYKKEAYMTVVNRDDMLLAASRALAQAVAEGKSGSVPQLIDAIRKLEPDDDDEWRKDALEKSNKALLKANKEIEKAANSDSYGDS